MIEKSYCQKPPIDAAIKRSFEVMTLDEMIEIEEAMQRWREFGVEGAHVYERIGTRYEILVRHVPFSKRRLVAVYDKNRNKIEAVNLEPGLIADLIAPAYLLIGWKRQPGASINIRNVGWTG